MPPEVEWVQAELQEGRGLREAVSDVQAILHSATSPFSHTRKVDVMGTRFLLEEARAAGAEHFIYPSIVGIDKIPFSYYVCKREADAVVGEGGVPWTILRITQFHSLIDGMLQAIAGLPVMPLPRGFQFQSIDAGEVALRLLQCVASGPSGQLPDFAGPEVHPLREMAKYLYS